MLQGSWALGFLLSSAAYGLLYDSIGWRGLLWIGILPALVVVWVRKYVKEPRGLAGEPPEAARAENGGAPAAVRDLQARHARQHADRLLVDGERRSWSTTRSSALFATHLQKDLALSAALVAVPLMFSNAATFAASFLWGWVADVFGRRWSMIIPAIIASGGHADLSVDQRPT